MGHHSINPARDYEQLRRRLDDDPCGAPPSPALDSILRLLFRPEEASLAAGIPARLVSIEDLALRLNLPQDELRDRLDDMARRGLVLDVVVDEVLYVTLAPVVIGFFEFTFMRARPDTPMVELARLFEEYMELDGSFARTLFAGTTQLGRTVPHESSLTERQADGDSDDETEPTGSLEFCQWDRVSEIVNGARLYAVSLCACRHAASHRDAACSAEQENCLSFDRAADFLVRRGMARSVDRAEAFRILERARESGLIHTADNVQKGVGYICNCCACCCGMLGAIRRFEIARAIQPSSALPLIAAESCTGCGACVKICPVDAMAVSEVAEVDPQLCLGCGLCHGVCRFAALRMIRRLRPMVPPETMYHRIVAQAIERGRLGRLLRAGEAGLSSRALGYVVSALEAAPPTKALLAVESVKSRFLKTIVGYIRRDADVLSVQLEHGEDRGGDG